MQTKVSNYIAEKLLDAGITNVFMITGGGAMHLDDALGHQEGLHCMFNHHEQACAMAAESYARITGRVAAVCVTTGPGGINAMTGVAGGYMDSIPMFILSGQVRYDTTARSTGLHLRGMGDQEYDITKSVESMTKYSEMVIDPMRIRFCIEKALYLAYAGRPGPVWLDIPLNVQAALIDSDALIGFDVGNYEAGGTGWAKSSKAEIPEDSSGRGEYREALAPKVTREMVQAVLEKIRASKRPVINAGNGIRIGGAHDVFMRVVELLGIPVVTGADSIDCIYDAHPLYIGKGGNVGDRPGNFAIQNSDLLLSLGSRLSFRQIGYRFDTWAREAYIIVNDIDAEELKKPTIHIDMKLHADVKDLLTVMEEVLMEEASHRMETPHRMEAPHRENPSISEMPHISEIPHISEMPYISATAISPENGAAQAQWVEICQGWKKDYPVVLSRHLEDGTDTEANVYAFARGMSDRLNEGQIVVVGNGSANVVCGHGNIIKKGQRFISNSGIASMGYGLPAAIGACVADQKEDVILVTGDGSLQMNLQELQTVIGYELPIKMFIINNGGYHSIRQTQKNFFGEPLIGIGVDSGDLTFPSLEKLAFAYGFPYVAIHNNKEIGDKVEETLAIDGPVLCEVFVTLTQNFEPKSAAKRLPDGTLVSPPLEDLSPFLPEEEMERIMLIPRIKN